MNTTTTNPAAPDLVGDALAHVLLAPIYEMAGIELPVGSVHFADIVPNPDDIADPVERAEAVELQRILLDLHAGIERRWLEGNLS